MKIDIAALRSRLGGISQEELAGRVGVSQSTISRAEDNGCASGPLLLLLKQIEQSAEQIHTAAGNAGHAEQTRPNPRRKAVRA